MGDKSNSAWSQLTSRINRGDVQAMAEYLQLRRHDLLRVILSKMGPGLRAKVEADDIYQEVCESAIKSFAEVDLRDDGLFGWLCELASRRVVDADRKFSAQKRAAHREVSMAGRPDQSQIGLANLLVASITSPSQAFSRHQREVRLLGALERLPEEQRRVLEMKYGEGKPSKEIAQQIGKTDGATRVLITRALQKLRSELDLTEGS